MKRKHHLVLFSEGQLAVLAELRKRMQKRLEESFSWDQQWVRTRVTTADVIRASLKLMAEQEGLEFPDDIQPLLRTKTTK